MTEINPLTSNGRAVGQGIDIKPLTKHLDREALVKLCDPANYLGEAGAMVDRVLAMRGQ